MLVGGRSAGGGALPLHPADRARVEPQESLLLEPGVGVEHPIGRLQPVVGHHDDGRLVPVQPSRLPDEVAHRAVERPVHAEQLVTGIVGAVRRMFAIVSMPGEMPGDVGGHEVHAQEPELGFELHRQQTHVGDLADVADQRVGQRVCATGPSGGGDGRDQGRMRGQDPVGHRHREDLGYCGPPKPVTTIPSIGSAGYVNRTVMNAERIPLLPGDATAACRRATRRCPGVSARGWGSSRIRRCRERRGSSR